MEQNSHFIPDFLTTSLSFVKRGEKQLQLAMPWGHYLFRCHDAPTRKLCTLIAPWPGGCFPGLRRWTPREPDRGLPVVSPRNARTQVPGGRHNTLYYQPVIEDRKEADQPRLLVTCWKVQYACHFYLHLLFLFFLSLINLLKIKVSIFNQSKCICEMHIERLISRRYVFRISHRFKQRN